VVQIAAKALEEDLKDLSGKTFQLYKNQPPGSYPIIIGTIGYSKLIDQLNSKGKINTKSIQGQWEAFHLELVSNPFPGVKQALVIAGSDRRGTAFGVFELSRMIGVSPWKWWADVTPKQKKELYLLAGKSIEQKPDVQYRGIFLNDEDWGLQPWAAGMMDKDVKDIGPHTYQKIFELLLRLKANYIWPAMHPCTRAFYYYSDNPKLADDYSIVVGSSHCEPMLRNNVFEWAVNYEKEYGRKPGEWRYDLNQQEIYQYWQDRVQASKNYESVYTVGMRGIHDGSMPGPKAMPEKVKLLQKIIEDQRKLLGQVTINRSGVPQIFCPYKEVLDVYRQGVVLPEDVTIVWSDDNHGYMRQLSNKSEQLRSGGSGVYYHLSYWGAPQDYLWLSSVSPSLVSFEMTRAFEHGAKKLWVFNVGDIKPAEMETQFALDLAWDTKRWSPEKASGYAAWWAEQQFGKENAAAIASIKQRYYLLAASAKPEHMASVSFTPKEAEQRLKEYRQLADDATALKAKIDPSLQDAYYELIYYPVTGARLMNEKILLAQKAGAPGLNDDERQIAYSQAEEAWNTIKANTETYNKSLAGGKWNGIMSWKPRDLPVFAMPALKKVEEGKKGEEEKKWIAISSMAIKGGQLTIIDGLGISGKSVTLPAGKKFSEKEKGPWLEYRTTMPAGNYDLIVRCLPTQSVEGDGKLVYGIQVDNGPVQYVNLHVEADTKEWKLNVVRGYSEGHTITELTKGAHVIRLYPVQSGLVFSSFCLQSPDSK
jgi:hypothetical protein